MIIKIKTPCAIAAAALTVAGALVSPQAMALSNAERVAAAASNKADALEAQLQAVQSELMSLRAAVNSPRNDGTAEKVQELDQWMNQVKSEPTKANSKYNMVFFRGGYGRNDHGRQGSILTDANATNEPAGSDILGIPGLNTSTFTGNKPNGNQDAWYFGAGFDLNLSDNLFGMMDNTNLLGEITIGYKQFDSTNLRRAPLGTAANDSATGAVGAGGAESVVCAGLTESGSDGVLINNGAGPYGSCSANVTVTQISITASPKIKFMADSKFRPWIIPAGFAIHVVSPPSDGVTYIAPGMMFGAGADYNIWNNLYVGVDARYHLVSNTVADVQLDGMEAGGYVGFGF